MKLNENVKKEILALQKQYPEKRSALIPALHLAQNQVGYLPIELQQEVADLFGLDLNEVHAVVTFYDMFHEEPMGKHLIHICKNASCMLRGADGVIDALCKKLGISLGETTKDGKYSVIGCECLAACDKAPMALVDEKVVGPLSENNLDALLKEAEDG